MKRDYTEFVQRLTDTESRAGIQLSGMSAFLDDDGYLHVAGEMLGNQAFGEDDQIVVVLTVFDAAQRVIETSEYIVFGSDYIGIEPFKFVEDLCGRSPARIRVHVKKQTGS